jgi:hypothetical protein
MFSVMKTRHPKPTSRTHFEQIPVNLVKKIADGKAYKTKKAGLGNLIVWPASRQTEPDKGPVRQSVKADIELPLAARPK